MSIWSNAAFAAFGSAIAGALLTVLATVYFEHERAHRELKMDIEQRARTRLVWTEFRLRPK